MAEEDFIRCCCPPKLLTTSGVGLRHESAIIAGVWEMKCDDRIDG